MNRYPISKYTAFLLLSLDTNLTIMCMEYGDDEDWVEVFHEDLDTLQESEYKTFEIWA